MNTLDDVTLLQQFVTGEAVFAANQNLRIEPAFAVNQLLSRSGALLATITLSGDRTDDPPVPPAIVTVRQGCDCWALLHDVLSAQGFLVIGEAAQAGFIRYEAQRIPVGYQMNCAEAKILYQVWTERASHYPHNDIRLDLLIFTQSTWYPIQKVVFHRGIVSIKTLISAISVQDGDYVAWIQRVLQEQPQG